MNRTCGPRILYNMISAHSTCRTEVYALALPRMYGLLHMYMYGMKLGGGNEDKVLSWKAKKKAVQLI